MLIPLAFVAVLAMPAQQLPPTTTATATAVTPPQAPYEFTSDLGAFLIIVKSEKAPMFETAMGRLRQALAQSTVAIRKQQAAGWRVLKSTEPPTDGNITYLFLIDPVIKQASYDPIEIIRELAPNDVQAVYDQLKDAWVSATRIGLKELMKMGGS